MPAGNWDALWRIGQNKDRPVLNAHLTENEGVVGADIYADDPERYDPIDLTGAAVEIIAEHIDGGGLGIADGTCEVVNVETGEIRFQAAKEDLIHDGTYEAQFDITFEDGSEQRVPSVGTTKIWVGRNTRDTQLYDSITTHAAKSGGTHGIASGNTFASQEWVLDSVSAIEGLLPEETGDMDAYILDDFRDYPSDPSSRSGQISGNHYLADPAAETWATGRYRPAWFTGGDVSSGPGSTVHLGGTGDSYIRTQNRVTSGHWSVEFEFDSLPDSFGRRLYVYPVRKREGDLAYWRISLDKPHGIKLEYRTPSDSSFRDVTQHRYPFREGLPYRLDVTRTRDGRWTIQVNGEHVISYDASGSWMPDASGGEYDMRLTAASEAAVNVSAVHVQSTTAGENVHAGDTLKPTELDATERLRVGGRSVAPAETQYHEAIGPSTFASPEPTPVVTRGPLIRPHETVHIGDVDVISDTSGPINLVVSLFREGSGETRRLDKQVHYLSAGRNTIDIDLTLPPVREQTWTAVSDWDGYLFSYFGSDEPRLSFDSTAGTPFSHPALTIQGGANRLTGATYSGHHYYFLDMEVASASTEVPTSTGGGGGTEDNVAYVHAGDGAGAVNSALTSNQEVYVYGDSVTWTSSVRVPSNRTLRFQDGLDISVAQSHSMESGTVAVNGTTRDFQFLVANSNFDTGNEDITISGRVEFDFSALDEPDDGRLSGVMVHNCSDVRFEDFTVSALKRATGDVGSGEIGILFQNTTDSVMRECESYDSGYECIGVRGNCRDIDIIDCVGRHTDGSFDTVHAFQAASISGRVNGSDSARPPVDSNIRLIRFNANVNEDYASDSLSIHGTQENVIGGIQFIDCKAGNLSLGGSWQNVTVDGGKIGRIRCSDFAESYTEQQSLRVRNVEHLDITTRGLEVQFGNEGHLTDVTVSDVEVLAVNGQMDQYMWLSEMAGASTVSDVDIKGTTARLAAGASAFVRNDSTATASEVTEIRLHDNKVSGPSNLVSGPMSNVRLRLNATRSMSLVGSGPTNVATSNNDDW